MSASSDARDRTLAIVALLAGATCIGTSALFHSLTLAGENTPGIKGGYLGVVHTFPSEMAQNFWLAAFAFAITRSSDSSARAPVALPPIVDSMPLPSSRNSPGPTSRSHARWRRPGRGSRAAGSSWRTCVR